MQFDNRERILSAVTMRSVFNMFCPNIEPDRAGRCPCPIHGGKKNSFKIYDDTNSFYCFACGSAGDPIKFVSLLEDISYGQAIQSIATAFGISLHKNPTKAETARLKKARRIADLIIEIDKKEQASLEPLTQKKGELIQEIIDIQNILQTITSLKKYPYEEYALIKSNLDYAIYQLNCIEDEISEIKEQSEKVRRRIRNDRIGNCVKQQKVKGREYTKPNRRNAGAGNIRNIGKAQSH